jgi:hypothetical protein
VVIEYNDAMYSQSRGRRSAHIPQIRLENRTGAGENPIKLQSRQKKKSSERGLAANQVAASTISSITAATVGGLRSAGPSPAARSDSSIVYAGSLSCLHRRLWTLLRQWEVRPRRSRSI